LPPTRFAAYPGPMKLIAAFALLAVSQTIAATHRLRIPEENYDFLSVTSGPCLPQSEVSIEPRYKLDCKRMTKPGRYRGTWFVAFETSFFTPAGSQSCAEKRALTSCAELRGKKLPWPSRWACPRKFEVEFIGRRNVLPRAYPAYRIVVNRLISAKRLPDPPHEADECDQAAP
jgi:hypothetical protein